MLIISQHFNIVSVTESDTVFRVASKERELHKPVVSMGVGRGGNMDSVKVQTGTFEIYMYIYNSKIYLTLRLKQSQSLVFPRLKCSLW